MPNSIDPRLSDSYDEPFEAFELGLEASEQSDSPQEINDRRARLENTEALRLARSL